MAGIFKLIEGRFVRASRAFPRRLIQLPQTLPQAADNATLRCAPTSAGACASSRIPNADSRSCNARWSGRPKCP